MQNWCETNKLFLNDTKTYGILATTTQRRKHLDITNFEPYLINGNNVEIKESEKLLGVIIDENLNWNSHIYGNNDSEGLLINLSQKICHLNRLSHICDSKTLLNIANGIFMSSLSFAMPLWGGTSEQNIHKLQMLQNRALRAIFRAGIRTPMKLLLNKSG